ncbi:hypothetical protein [Methanohalophilus profundi]|nr:hypothetical protein [Methanohalophilus profundi]
MVVDTDSHHPSDLITTSTALKVAMGAGLEKDEAKQVLENSRVFI